jgi:hypothetical protein
MSQEEMTVMSMLGCTHEEAQRYLDNAGGDALKAVEMHLVIPDTPGNKYIPEKPKTKDGLDDTVREKLSQARQLSEMFNASLRNDLVVSQKTSEVHPR